MKRLGNIQNLYKGKSYECLSTEEISCKVAKIISTFMNHCEDGACGNIGKDIVSPNSFEQSALDAMENLHCSCTVSLFTETRNFNRY